MAKDLMKTERTHEEDLNLADPFSSLAQTEEDVQERRVRLIERLQRLWNERRLIGRASAAGFLASIIIALIIPNRFTSVARLMPPDQEASSTGAAMLAAMAGKAGSSLGNLGAQLLGLKTTGDLFIGILQSRTVENDLVTTFDLRRVYGERRWEDARKDLSKRTAISQDRKSDIITISVTDRDPDRAQRMAAAYITELDNVVTNMNTSSAHRERVFLEGRLSQVQQDLESAEKQFSEFASKNTALDIQEQGKAMITAGATLEGQLIAVQTELEGLRQIYTDSNVRVRETQARIDELRRQLQKLSGQTSNASQPQNAETPYPTIRQLPLLGVSYADLYRRMKVEETVFETLTQEYELAKVEEAKETPSVKVLDPPDVPEKKSFPPRSLIVVFGTLLTGTLGVVWVLGRARWDATSSNDPGKAFVVQVLTDVRQALPPLPRFSANGSADGSKTD
jgi:uncharacterized protein involved in exopolysaccharide biosynthesis